MKLLGNYINKRSLIIDSNIVVNENLKPMYTILNTQLIMCPDTRDANIIIT